MKDKPFRPGRFSTRRPCPVCRRIMAVGPDGRIVEHGAVLPPWPRCAGSGERASTAPAYSRESLK